MHAANLNMALLMILGLLSGGTPDRRADPVGQSGRDFQAVMRHLEPGGDVLLVLNTENVVRGWAEELTDLVGAVTEGDADAAEARRVAEALPGFLDRNGFLALRAVGLSSVPEGNGLLRTRVFLLRDTDAAESPLWRGLVGGNPRSLASHAYWTEEVAWGVSTTGEPAELWKVVRSVVDELVPEGREGFEALLEEAEEALGISLEDLMLSLGDEGFAVLTLDKSATFQVPGLDLAIPVPGVLIGLRLKHPLLVKRLEALLQELETQMPVVSLAVGDTTQRSVPLPIPVPFPFHPTFAYREADSMLLLGSSPETVRKALESASGGQNRLLESQDFLAECGGPVGDSNGILYTSARFGRLLASLQQATLNQALQQDPSSAPVLMRLQKLLPTGTRDLTITLNLEDGVLWSSRGTLGAGRYVKSMLVAPAGLLAGIAVPSFVKARETARQNACINQLRMLDAAKEQWALVSGAADGAEPDADAVAEYIRHGIPLCPQSNKPYRLNPIGTDPECTSGDPSHRLP